ncbi:hypothetical protein H4S02_001557 [Coemansia sp. RSA 2611]|nr:hypothetical protein H4S02_001557 [Coemansia sp. RSA 2611]
MSDEKRIVFANGHVYEPPSDLESGGGGSPAQCHRCSGGRRVVKRVLLFVVGFFVAQSVLHAVFGRQRMLERAYEYGRMSMWGDDVAHKPHWNHHWHGHHHGHHPPHYDYESDDEEAPRHHRPHYHHGEDDVPHRRPYHRPYYRPYRPYRPYPHHDYDSDKYVGDAPRYRRPHPRPHPPHRRPPFGHPLSPPHGHYSPYHPHPGKPGYDKPKDLTRFRPKPITSAAALTPALKLSSAFNHASHVNREALNRLIKGDLPATELGRMLLPGGDMCNPTVPVSGLETFTFDPAEFGKIVNKVVGGIGSDISITTTTDDKASLEVTAVASSEELAKEITLTNSTTSDGIVSFHLNGPKWLGKGQCAFANIVLKIPETTTNLVALRNNFVYGNIKVDRKIAHAITFGDFEINAALSPISVPSIRADNVIINSVSGGVHGYFHITNSIALHSVRGRIDAGVNVRKASKSSITAESVTGKVTLRVAGGFDGSFVARAIGGKVEVEDVSDGSSRMHFDKDFPRVKTGTFGPAESTRVGDSSLRATVVSGSVEVEFE